MRGGRLARPALRAGLLGGVGLTYLCLVGMIERFGGIRLVEGWISLGRLLVVLPPLFAGLLLVRPRVKGGQREAPPVVPGLVAGTMAGLVAGAMVAIGLLLVDVLPDRAVQNVFTSVTTPLLNILTFGKTTGPGMVILVAVCGLSGAAGASLGLLPRTARGPAVVGLLVPLLMGMLQNVARVALTKLGVPTGWLYSARFGGLTLVGVVVVFAAATSLSVLWATRGVEVRRRLGGMPREGRRSVMGVGTMLLILLLIALPLLLGPFLSSVLGRVGIFMLMGLGLNIVVGYAGLLDLGYVAFFAVGAYSTGVLTAAANSGSSLHPGLPFFIALVFVLLIAVVIGLLIGTPVLRLRGDYLALVTLGFGEIARVLVTSDWLRSFLGGAQGLIAIPAPQIHWGGFDVNFRDPQPFYYLVLGFCLLAIFVSSRLADSRVGRAWSAMREDEQVAEAMGVSTVKYKLLAFGAGAAIGSVSGSLFAVQIGSLSPASFTILVSITALAIVILGGMGSISGVVVGALVLIGLPGFLTEFEQYQLLIYGAVLIGIMILRPEGLIPNVKRSRELHEEEREQDAWLGREPAVADGSAIAVGSTETVE